VSLAVARGLSGYWPLRGTNKSTVERSEKLQAILFFFNLKLLDSSNEVMRYTVRVLQSDFIWNHSEKNKTGFLFLSPSFFVYKLI
jgi:hypothetical protein